MPPSKAKQYRIGNPRNVSAGTRIIEYFGQEWFEGDDFVAPEAWLPKDVKQYIDQGFIVEVEA